MDFSLSEEQTILKDSVSKYVDNDYGFDQRQKLCATEEGFSREHWAAFAELGWLTVPFAEDVGGFGGQIEDTAVLMEEFGKGLVLEPYLANVLLAGQLIARSGNGDAIDNQLASIMSGSHQTAMAAQERQGRQDFQDVLATAKANDDSYVLNGTKVLVLNGGAAETLVVTARTSGGQFDRAGISLFLVDAAQAGVAKTVIPMMDGSRVANIHLNDVTVPASTLLGESDQAWSLLEPVIQEARIAVCAEALGIIDALYRKTVEYSQTRKQFGVPIGSFQALQHRMVDMFMLAEQSRSIVYRAMCEYQQGDSSAAATIAAMKSVVGKHGRHIGAEAIQIHGGMGITDELDIGHYVKRLLMLNQLFGDVDDSLREFCTLAYGAGSTSTTQKTPEDTAEHGSPLSKKPHIAASSI
jgi:alkylation response protein AidB-like acyl-CoA dehydrogenase